MKFLTLAFILSTIPLTFGQGAMSGGTGGMGGKGGNGANDPNIYLILTPEYEFTPVDCAQLEADSFLTLSVMCSQLDFRANTFVITYDQNIFYNECCPFQI